MFDFDDARKKHDEAYEGGHKGHLSHEVVAGGVAFEAMKKWEDHQRAEGKPVSHGFAKEALTSFTGAEMDKWAESKGMNHVDKEKAKHSAKHQAQDLYDQQYGGQDAYDPSVQAYWHIDDC
ncbi:CipC protein [Emericellopsis atlantica]|uniref:CipC protein n=1 Tax=Emericellopsis atlantica TaxID=2614577 RepID=A0A9P7ZJ02_9HYPO|nr:CipC protein [Emericellopsis atlantica]KAG9252393.1 CipC protein [Emericellopsis atlantica]